MRCSFPLEANRAVPCQPSLTVLPLVPLRLYLGNSVSGSLHLFIVVEAQIWMSLEGMKKHPVCGRAEGRRLAYDKSVKGYTGMDELRAALAL